MSLFLNQVCSVYVAEKSTS